MSKRHATDWTEQDKWKKRDGRLGESQNDEQHARRTELVFILDASGSMAGLEDDTVGGFNAMIAENREAPGEATVTLVTFNSSSHVVIDRADINDVRALMRRQYHCSGCTALLDAVGEAIDRTDLVQRVQPAGYQADKVLFVITTDGMENASKRYSYRRVKQLIEAHRAQGWEFIFIGANIDVAAEAARLGVDAACAVEYVPDEAGTGTLYRAASCAVRDVRAGTPLPSSAWRDELDRDVRRRR